MPLEQVLTSREVYKKQIQARDALLRLENNKDFQLIILDGFMDKDCARQAKLSISSINEEARRKALGAAQAAGYLDEYLTSIILLGNSAERNLHELDASDSEE